MEAFIENKDVGFVQQGQAAEVKVDAFEYTKYGTTTGQVSHVSHDAIQDEKRGLIYSVKVALDHSTMIVNGRELPLTPGMSSTVEIKTGTRRVIEYVLSPLIQHGRESLRER
jgi:hemolysin D